MASDPESRPLRWTCKMWQSSIASVSNRARHRVLGETYEAMGNRADADAAFRRSINVLEAIESRPELAQTLLAYGRFRRGDNQQEDQSDQAGVADV